jgi:hypothetical protein
MRSLARSRSKVVAISRPSRYPWRDILASRRWTVSSSVKFPSTPGAEKSIRVLSRVADLTRWSPMASR